MPSPRTLAPLFALALALAPLGCAGTRGTDSTPVERAPRPAGNDAVPAPPMEAPDAAPPLALATDAAVTPVEVATAPDVVTLDAAPNAVAAPDAARADAARPRRTDAGTTTAAANNTPGPATPTATAASGRAGFDRACGRCHPGGNEDIGPRLRGIQWTEARMRAQVRNGGGSMRPIPPSRLSDPDLASVIGYLRTMNAVR